MHVPGVDTALLGSLERHAGTLEERLDVRPVVGEECHSQARGDEQVVPADREGATQGEPELVGDHRHVLVPVQAREQDHEDVATGAGYGVPLPQRAHEGVGDALEKIVSEAPAKPVVDLSEAVEPELYDGELAVVPLRVNDGDRQAIGKETGARDSGQGVVVAQGLELGLDPRAGLGLLPELRLQALDLSPQGPDLLLEPLFPRELRRARLFLGDAFGLLGALVALARFLRASRTLLLPLPGRVVFRGGRLVRRGGLLLGNVSRARLFFAAAEEGREGAPSAFPTGHVEAASS